MRILTVCASTNVFGAEIVTLKMLEGLKRAGHEQLAVTSTWTDGEFNARLLDLEIPEIRLPLGALSKRLALRPMWWTANVIIRLPKLWVGWLRAIRQFRPDVILFTTWRQALALYPVLPKTSAFMIEFTYLDPTPTRRRLYQLLARKLTGFIAVSDFMRGHTIKIGAPGDRVYLVQSAVFSASDPLRYAPIAERTSGKLRLGIVGQIAKHKGHECLIDAVQLLGPTAAELEVYIFGRGDTGYIDKLRAKLAESKLSDRFHWVGYQENPANIYRSFDICVVPSILGDPFPTVAMEAGAFARPVIASRTGGLPEIVEHGVTGWLAEPGNPQDLAKYIKECIEHRERIPEMGRTARERIFSQFSQEAMVKKLEELFVSFENQPTHAPQLTGSGRDRQ